MHLLKMFKLLSDKKRFYFLKVSAVLSVFILLLYAMVQLVPGETVQFWLVGQLTIIQVLEKNYKSLKPALRIVTFFITNLPSFFTIWLCSLIIVPFRFLGCCCFCVSFSILSVFVMTTWTLLLWNSSNTTADKKILVKNNQLAQKLLCF